VVERIWQICTEQIRVLLGEPAPTTAAQRRQADAGVDRFWQAYRSDR
jgi:hypothetical protein